MKPTFLRPYRIAALVLPLLAFATAPCLAQESATASLNRALPALARAEAEVFPLISKAAAEPDFHALWTIYNDWYCKIAEIYGDGTLNRSVCDLIFFFGDGAFALWNAAAEMEAAQSGSQESRKQAFDVMEAATIATLRAQVAILLAARSAGAAESANQLAPFWTKPALVLCGEADFPELPEGKAFPPNRFRRLKKSFDAHASDKAKVPPRRSPRNTPAALKVSAAVAALANCDRTIADKVSQTERSDVASMARLTRERLALMGKIDVSECPETFRKSWLNLGRSLSGLANLVETASKTPETDSDSFSSLFLELSIKQKRLRQDQTELLRSAQREGADISPLFSIWFDSVMLLAMSSGDNAAPAPRPTANSPAQRYMDAFASLVSDFAAASDRAPGGPEGAKDRLAAAQALFTGVKKLDVSALPPDVARAHKAFLSALRQIGLEMKRLADESAKGPAAFLAAVQSSQAELDSLEKNLKTASDQLEKALRSAGADVSALDRFQ